MKRLITTSWDDGHPLDYRLAELLDKYSLPATFYIPKSNPEHEVMKESAIAGLASRFEIGGHTLHHTRLNGVQKQIDEEIYGCYSWLEDLIGRKPVSFCFPGGVYDKTVIKKTFSAGFEVLRTTELLSTANTSYHSLMPTTLQIYEGSSWRYIRHLAKRMNVLSFIGWAQSGYSKQLLSLTDHYIQRVIKYGGCFHLWGHSWEIEDNNLWGTLELIFQKISNITECSYVTNGDALIKE